MSTLPSLPEMVMPAAQPTTKRSKRHHGPGSSKETRESVMPPVDARPKPGTFATVSLLNSLRPFDASDESDYSADDDSPLNESDPLQTMYNILDPSMTAASMFANLNSAQFPSQDEWKIQSGAESPDAASLIQLLLYLTSPDAANLNFQRTFLVTHVSFTTPYMVMAALGTRFYANILDPSFPPTDLKNIRMRVIRIISIWTKIAPYQFDDKMVAALKIISSTLEKMESTNQKVVIDAAISSLKDDGKSGQRNITYKQPMPALILPDKDPSQWTLMDIDPKEIARQVTIMHSKVFREIKVMELLTAIWGTEKGGGSQHLNELTNQFDIFSRYVSLSVIQGPDPHTRGRIHKNWVDAAQEFLQLRNYHGVFAVICGLGHPSVTRMADTMKYANKTNRARKNAFEEMKKLCDFGGDFANYRPVLERAIEPCVPFIGCLQRDLIYVQEGFPNKSGNLLNFKKSVMCYSFVEKVTRKQNESYPLQTDETIQNLLKQIETMDIPDTIGLMKLSVEKEKKKKK